MSRPWTKHFVLIPVLAFLGIAAGLVVIWQQMDRVEDRMLNLRTETTTEQVALRLENFIASRLHLVRQMAYQWESGQINTPESFAEMAEAIEAQFSSLQAINWIDPDGVIRWLVPEDRNLGAKDRALSAHRGLGDILADAAAQDTPRASPPLSLFQGGRGFGTYFPLLRDGRLEGYLNGVFRMEPVVADCLGEGVLGDFYLRIEDEGKPLYAGRVADELMESPLSRQHAVHVLDREWRLTLVPTPRTVDVYRSEADEAFLILGLIVAVGFAVTLKSFLQRQNVLSESEQRLRIAVENMPAMVAAFDGAGRIIVWNRYCERVTGFSSGEIVGNPQARSLLEPRRVESPSDNDRPFGLAAGQDQEWILTCKDGATRMISWSNASAGLRVPGWKAWGVGNDITERRKIEDALRLTQYAMDHSAVATFWVREDAGFSYVNEAACRSLGYTRDELLRMTVWDIDPVFPREGWKENWEQIMSSGVSQSFETQHRRKDGTTFPVEITGSPLRYKGQDYQFAFVVDITERKRVEAERLEMERSLLETQKLESLGLLAGGVAHDFNNLLTAVMGSASLARGLIEPTSPLATHLGHIEAAAQQAADLARQLLAYSGKGKFVLTSVDVRRAVMETEPLLRISIPRSVTVRSELGDTPLCVRGDPGQIRQIVMNLVINAAEAAADGEATVVIRAGVTELDQASSLNLVSDGPPADGRYVSLEVADNGPGMDVRTQSRIFEPFFSTKATGRGLGLAAVLGIVRGHRGAIKVDSDPGRGTTFTVFLPQCDEAGIPEVVEAPAGELPAPGGTVLVVDDEDSVRSVAKIILEDSGFSVLTAADGQHGVELFREHADDIRVVLLDLTMPRMDGRQALREIRRIRPDVRVLLSSGYDEGEAGDELAGNRVTAFIQKPYRAEQLLRRIQAMLAE